MNILDIELEAWHTIVLSLNWLAIIIILTAIVVGVWVLKKYIKFVSMKSINIDEVNLGIGNSSVKLTYSKKDQEIAYKLWVEMSTRKIGMCFDTENDVIKEVYDSWYEFFKTARELLKEIPINRILYSRDLIKLTENILNLGLRPHLTKWQAKYRKWYDEAVKNNERSPQDIQREYPEYTALVEDLVLTNKIMIEYKDLMKKIAFEGDEC